MNLKIGSHAFHLSLTVLALVAGGLLVYAHLGNGAAADAWLASARQELATANTWKQRMATLATQASQARRAAARLADSAASLTARFDALLAAAQSPHADSVAPVSLGELGAACHAAIDACRARGDSLAAADSLDRIRADTAERRAIVADSIIHLGVKATSCKFLALFPCPSREQAFFLGAAITAIGAVVTHH